VCRDLKREMMTTYNKPNGVGAATEPILPNNAIKAEVAIANRLPAILLSQTDPTHAPVRPPQHIMDEKASR
jgi:hypothetical protein